MLLRQARAVLGEVLLRHHRVRVAESEGEGPGEDSVRHVHNELRRPGAARGIVQRTEHRQQVGLVQRSTEYVT